MRHLLLEGDLDGVHGRDVTGVDPGGHASTFGLQRPVTDGLVHEPRHERHQAGAAVVGQPGQHVVGHVARVVADRERRGVGEDHWSAGDVEGVAHHVVADVGQVDQHPEAVHLAHDLAAEVVETAEHGLVGRRVGPGHVVVVGEGQVADAEPVVHPQDAERLLRSGGHPRRPSGRRSGRCPTPPRSRWRWSRGRAGRRTARPWRTPHRPARASTSPSARPRCTARRPTRTARPLPRRAAAAGPCGSRSGVA